MSVDSVATSVVNETPDSDVEITPGTEVEVTTSKKGRKKKLVYPVPADKLSYPVGGWSLDHSKLKEDDFKTVQDFKQWEAYQYFDARITRVRAKADEAIARIEEDRQPLLAELKYADTIREEFAISEDSELEVGDVMRDLSKGLKSGLSKEMVLRMLEIISEEE
jgi:hypothetical protein